VDGNLVTSRRWASLLQDLGHRASVVRAVRRPLPDVLVALHAVKSARAVASFRRERPDAPVVVILTGTDVYGDLRRSEGTLRLATRVVALQADAARRLASRHRGKVRVVRQSAAPLRSPGPPPRRTFRVAVLAHLRPVKDAWLVARASRRLAAGSRVRVVHAGAALTAAEARRARREETRSPRYRWLGALSAGRARRLIAGSHVVVIPSRAEGSSNVLAEALADGVPVLATRIPGFRDVLGPRHPGSFPVGDARALAHLLHRAETDPGFLARLAAASRARAPLVHPERERDAIRALLAGLPSRRGT
jgi:putative glycosyltransferase (TIGR04348 family)